MHTLCGGLKSDLETVALETVTKRGVLGGIKRHCSATRFRFKNGIAWRPESTNPYATPLPTRWRITFRVKLG